MNHWLYPANVKFYDVLAAFSKPETYWPVNSKVSVGDIIYFYLVAPFKQIGYVCRVTDTGLEKDTILDKIQPYIRSNGNNKKKDIDKLFMRLKVTTVLMLSDDSSLSYEHLKENGLNGMLMGPRKLENNPQLLDYIERKT